MPKINSENSTEVFASKFTCNLLYLIIIYRCNFYWITGSSAKLYSANVPDIIWFLWLTVFFFRQWAQYFTPVLIFCGDFNNSFLYLNVLVVLIAWVSVPSLCFALPLSWDATAHMEIMKQWMVSFRTTWTWYWVYWHILFLSHSHNVWHRYSSYTPILFLSSYLHFNIHFTLLIVILRQLKEFENVESISPISLRDIYCLVTTQHRGWIRFDSRFFLSEENYLISLFRVHYLIIKLGYFW